VETGVTLTQHILHKQEDHPDASGELTALLTQIGVAGKLIQAKVRRAGIIEIWGATGDTNVQGETVQKLDRIANDTFVDVLKRSGTVAAMASEEEHDIIEVPPALAGGYVVLFDPLDGSTNIDANVTIGTIFSVYRRVKDGEVVRRDILRPGHEQVAAGYIIYGSSTVMVYTAGDSVNCFTLDPSAGEYFLTRQNIRMPDQSKILSVNECNAPYWPPWVSPFVDAIKGRNDADKRRVSSRHIGSWSQIFTAISSTVACSCIPPIHAIPEVSCVYCTSAIRWHLLPKPQVAVQPTVLSAFSTSSRHSCMSVRGW